MSQSTFRLGGMYRPCGNSLVVVAIAGTFACSERQKVEPDAVVDTTSVATAVADRPADWASELGPVLIVPSDTEQTGVVLFPATPSPQLIAAAPLTLVSPSGDVVRANASLVVSDSQVCGEAPTIRLGEAPAAWSVGLRTRSAVTLKMDSIESLSSSDSARLVADLARLASTVTTSQESRFSGLPFVVLSARHFEAVGARTVVAHLIRRLPQEASPLEEHTFVLGERLATPAADAYVLKFEQRSEGTEETADHYEVLAVARAGETTFLVLSREQEARTVYEILERGKSGWRVRWQRTLAC